MHEIARRVTVPVWTIFIVSVLFLASSLHEASAFRVVAWVDPTLIEEASQFDHSGDDGLISVIVTGFSEFSPTQIGQLSCLGKVNTVIGEIATVRLTYRNVWPLASLNFVSRVDGGYAKPELDVSVPEINAKLVWETIKDAQGKNVDGSGVIVGIVDTGIDWKHPDFRFENGSSKILYLWDQTEKGVAPAEYNYGTEWTRSQIETGVCTQKDTYGHGTHVAGIAVGTGVARGGKYVGVAPGSALIFVKSGMLTKKGWGFDFSQILDGVTYIWRKAVALGKRVVISLSLGGNSGGHDGTAPIEKGLDRLVSEGAVVIVSAGNSAAQKIHAEGGLRQGESINLGVKVGEDEEALHLETWFSRTDAFHISLRTPSGQRIEGPTSRDGASTLEGRVYISEDFAENGKAWVMHVSSSKVLPREGWTVSLTGKSIAGDGAWDAWIASEGEFTAGLGYEVTSRKTVSVPATARNTIAVGAYVTKMRWTGKDGGSWNYTTGESQGDIAVFSSIGPTRDGRLKPDICAPGKGIVAPRSSDIKPKDSDPDDFYTVKAGTSMAAPHVAGMVALVLQYNRHLGPNQAKSILQLTGKRDKNTREIDPVKGSMVWGYGKADAKLAVPRSSGMYSIRVSVKGLPASMSTKVLVDSVERGSVAGDAWMIFEFEDQATHTVSVERIVNLSDTTRYVASQDTLKFKSGALHTFLYTTQHYVEVVSRQGNPRGSGWYDAGSKATVSVESRVLAEATNLTPIYRKTTYYLFDGWTVEPLGSVSPNPALGAGTILVDGPKIATAQWRVETTTELDWAVIIVLVDLAAAVGVVLVIVVMKMRRQATERTFATKPQEASGNLSAALVLLS